MHRHGYKGRKLGRKRDQRRALLKGLASNLIDNGKLTTTLPKAKETLPYVERLITKAKVGDLHNRRQIITKVAHESSAHKLVDDIAPKLTARDSGHLRLTKTINRKGDNTLMAEITFVDDLTSAPVAKKAAPKPKKAVKAKAPAKAKKAPAKKTVKEKK